MRKTCILSLVFIVIAFGLEFSHQVVASVEIIKYLMMAFGITMLSYSLFKGHIYKQNRCLFAIGVTIVVIFVILVIDTYAIHALTWFPGIIRYPIFSAYLPGYILFVIPGWLLCY